MDDGEEWFAGVPFADPQIQKDYEAALGAFLVAFNRIEYTLNALIERALDKADRTHVWKDISNDFFERKLTNWEMLSAAFPQVANPKLTAEIRALGKERNALAHGHFDQNPFDGSYQVASYKMKLKRRPISISAIHALTDRAQNAWDKLRYAEAFFDFYDVVPGLPNDVPSP